MSDTQSNTIRFVATSQIPPSPPPASETGPVKWLRENMFSTIPNAALSLISIAVIVYAVASIAPWFIHSVWVADSLAQCREIDTGACFAVINERFNQFIFGFYPSDAYWRPILAFVLLVVAAAPILVSGLPRRMLYFTAVFPMICYFLVFGGSPWGPLLVVATFPIAWYVFSYVTDHGGPLGGLVAATVVAVVWLLFVVDPLSGLLADIIPIGLAQVQTRLVGGFLLTLIIGIVGIAGSFPIGILLALGRQSNLFIVKTICVGFIEFIRGVPLITLLFVASTLLNYFLPPGTNFDLLVRVLILVVLFASAYMAEVIRGGLAALPKGQYEAADALGLDYWMATRLIIMPQALKISIPGIVNTFIGLFKDTTLVSVIAMFDPLGVIAPIRADQNWNGIVWELYGFVALFFFICCFGMSRYSQYLERKLKTDHR
ncbi:amino acid ABC transporter permease [Paroceanicella profunda]|uniref:Amino acid ABC transporter permease n=1 Tax=Paroceanicella profunda TaxID=2579971 RepID=A0A5B8FU17_9RHOB|nr:amino acid ABC transporter permease [Paroceanicella profunda]QDL90580.1 amino acid ABC transporter permease [Paroceanicella profunda]